LLADVQQFDLEHQRCTRWDHPAGAVRAITEVGGDVQLPLAAALHARDAFVPAADHATGTERKHEGLATVAGTVEFLATPVGRILVVEPAGVMHADLVARGGSRAFPDRNVDALQLRYVPAGVGRRTAAGGEQEDGEEGDVAERATVHLKA